MVAYYSPLSELRTLYRMHAETIEEKLTVISRYITTNNTDLLRIMQIMQELGELPRDRKVRSCGNDIRNYFLRRAELLQKLYDAVKAQNN